MVCPNCGTVNDSDALFCGNCGTDLRNISGEDSQGADNVNSGDGQDADSANSVNVQGTDNANGGNGQSVGYVNSGSNQSAGYINLGNGQGNGYGQGSGYGVANAQAQAVARKPMSGWVFVIAAEALVLIIGAFILRGLVGDINAPERVAENYFVHVANGDWKAAYGCLDIDAIEEGNSNFINEEMFRKGRLPASVGIVSGYQVSSGSDSLYELADVLDGIDVDGNSLGKTVRIDYRVKGETENNTYLVSLNKMANNKWKVNASELLRKDYYISVPAGASVSVDGIELGADYRDAAIESEGDYVIPYIFCGNHEVKVTMEGMEDVAETVYIDAYSTQYSCESMKMTPELLDTLMQKAGENIQKIYDAAIAGKNFKTISELFSTDEEYLEYVKESYGNLLSGMNEGSNQIQKISFHNIKAETYLEPASIQVSFDYTVDYTYEDWWSGDREQDTYEGSTEIYVWFVKENENWVQMNLGCDTLYY